MSNDFEDTIKIDKILIKNIELNNLVQFKLDKTYYNKEDLKEIKEIVLNGKKINGEENKVFFEEIEFFTNLELIEINNIDIKEDNIEKIKNIDAIYFNNCKIEKIDELKNIKKISINNCIVNNLNIIKEFENLEELEIINMEVNDFNFLINLKNLKVLKIKNIKNFSFEKINFELPIKYLVVNRIDILEESLIKNYSNLEKISIDLERRTENIELLKKLKEKGIKVFFNEIYEF